jgi:hypothetical protein
METRACENCCLDLLKAATTLLALLPAIALSASEELAPVNPWLADSTYPITHVSSAQSGSLGLAGPLGPSRTLGDADIAYRFMGPAHLIQVISGPYPDGRRVIWSIGADRLVKQDYHSFDIVDTLMLREDSPYTPQWADSREDAIQNSRGPIRVYQGLREMLLLRESQGLYPLVDRDNEFYVIRNGGIEVFGDREQGNAGSGIELKRRFEMPPEAKGRLVGMNFTHDGWLIGVSEMGDVIAVARDFSRHYLTRLAGAPERAEKPGEQLSGWVRNSFAIDAEGRVYIVSRDFMHCIVWTGQGWSEDEARGAWREPYPNSAGKGSGATPTLMGFGEGDRLVVITDGDELMNLMLFWREEIPADWQGLPGFPRRVAGSQPANMGNPELKAVQSEQSVGVLGYGALIVNNEPANIPWYLPKSLSPVLVALLATDEDYRPLGVQKFQWDPATRTLAQAWVNREVSSPNSVPLISAGSGMVYTEGSRDGQWSLEALDWHSGESRFHWKLPRARHNTMFAPVVLDPDGRLMWGASWGRLRLQPLVAP